MADRAYTASLSKSQGRSGYSIIFRHPVRIDDNTGKPGLRVRQGLSTSDLPEAERLRAQLNELLATPRFHTAAARGAAAMQFDERVVDIFFYKISPEEPDFAGTREAVIPLPGLNEGYRRVLLLGTTGAGKTTLLRQLIGTDPERERFPSTSTAKTTVHDTEIVIDEDSWRAVVTFVPADEVREYLGECISAAALIAWKGADDNAVLARLLDHVNQRFRFSYVLGRGSQVKAASFGFEEEDDEGSQEEFAEDIVAGFSLTETNALLATTVDRLRAMAKRLGDELRRTLPVSDEKDERVLDEIFEENLDKLLREDEEFHEIADALMDEIERRFELLPVGSVTRSKQGWPLSWHATWDTEDRSSFIRALTRFSSNHAARFGKLLTPLVNGVRVAGPFRPTWIEDRIPRLVLLDGEGLGHVPRSTTAIATSVSRRIESADAVLLVDNAAQPMQAAPVAVMRELISTGNVRKLVTVFTHFDEVRGDNLPTASDKARHVKASAENALASMGVELGTVAERALRQRLDDATFFLAGIDEDLDSQNKKGRETIRQLQRMINAVERIVDVPIRPEGKPVYDKLNLVLAIKGAAESYLTGWMPRLGLTYRLGVSKEHWTRVRALSRRLATGWSDEYDDLRPVADLRRELIDRMFVFFQNPMGWDGGEPDDDGKLIAYNHLADIASKRLMQLAEKRVRYGRLDEWQEAYNEHGSGSSFRRARIIGNRILEAAAPIPDVTPSPDRNEFLHEVVAEVAAAAEEAGSSLR